MIKRIYLHPLLIGLICLLSLSACRTSAPNYNYQKLARAGILLGFPIEEADPHRLYTESAEWVGVPYRIGGDNKRGIDCSGLTYQIIRSVYHIKLSRTAEEQRTNDCHSIRKSNLQPGDLVFFGKRRHANHVGLYLKNGRFIHASNKGVVVSSLNETYYKRNWLSGGRIK